MNLKKKFNLSNRDIFSFSLIFILAASRLIPHPPNFTPIIAMALLSVFLFKNLYFSFFITISSMFLSDLFLGFYPNMIFVYFSLFLIIYIFFKFGFKFNSKRLFIYGFAGSLIFYLLSNFGVWFLGNIYSKDINGLINCYFMAIPFFKNTLLSTLIFSYLGYFVSVYNFKLVSKKTSK